MWNPRTIRDKIAADEDDSLAGRARLRRWELFRSTFPDIEDYRVVDLGGTVDFWTRAPVQPASVTVVNPREQTPSEDHPWIEALSGDATDPALFTGYPRFDLVYSNSTIEHVGGHAQCAAFAEAVHRLAERHWVQTPYRYFPIEPHYLFPGMQFLPAAWRHNIASRWPLGYTRSRGIEVADPVGEVLEIVLLSKTELQYYFPKSRMLAERVLGMTKSIIAVAE